MKKKLTSVFVLVILIVTSFTSCRKGPDDPFLTIRSRKARLTGNWVISSGSWTTTNYNAKSIEVFTPNLAPEFLSHILPKASSTIIYSFENDILTVNSSNDIYTENYTDSIIFYKDGTFEEYKVEDYNDPETSYSYLYKSTTKGYWYFLPANKYLDVENKQRVMVELTETHWSSTTTVSGLSYTNTNDICYDGTTGDNVIFVNFTELSNKEIKIILDSKKSISSGDYDETSGTVTYIQVK